jgi:hypothetical protein
MPTAGKFCTPSSPSEHHGFLPLFCKISNLFHLFSYPSSIGWELEKTVVKALKEVVPRSSIRSFKDDYYHADADVVLVAGETHVGRKPVSDTP